MMRLTLAAVLAALLVGCSTTPQRAASDDAAAGIDSLNARLSHAYRARDPEIYATLFTDSAVFEWPAFNTVRGRSALEAMARANWAAISDMDLRLDVATRRFAENHATEFGSFQQAYRDTTGTRAIEYGRYVAVLNRQQDGSWLMDRFFGFSDSTRPQPASAP